MDDPWGSPWAEELHQPVPAPDSKGTNGLPLAPITPGKNVVTTQKTNSPWDLPRNVSGSWEAPEEQQIEGNGDISSVGSEWGAQGARHLKKIDTSSLSPNWGESQPGSGLSTPKLYPCPLPKPTEPLRHASPDPWATIAVSPGVDLDDIPAVRDQDIKPSLEPAAISNIPREPHTQQHEAKRTTEVPDKDPTKRSVYDLSRPPSSSSDRSHHGETHLESLKTSLDEDSHQLEPQRHVSEKIQVLVEHYDALAKTHLEEPVVIGKGPNSVRGEDDDEESHGEQTSLTKANLEKDQNYEVESEEDEETKVEESTAAELVEEEKAEQPVAPEETKTEERKAEVEEEEADDDFGDFEDGHSQTSNSSREEEQASDGTKNSTLDVKSLRGQEEKTPPKPKIPSIRASMKDFGRVKYNVDKPVLDTLYPGLKSTSLSPNSAEKLYIPDMIPHDSFTSVEERKMWYRLSRYTTLRKHNSGDDDDSYIRVSWTGSKIREEILKITGKWMEQDRISGRVVLGGDSKDGSLFGWNDPKAAPMPLATAFAVGREKKKSNAPTKATAAIPASFEAPKDSPLSHVDSHPSSKPPQKHIRRSSTKLSKAIPEDTRQRIQQPVASFGWSSESQPAALVLGLTPKPVPSNSISSPQKPAASQLQPAPSITTVSTQKMPSSLDGWDAPAPIIKTSTNLQTASDTVAPVGPAQQIPGSFDGWNMSPVKTSAPAMLSTTIMQNSSNDSNDDWGDMISSPVITSPPRIPPLRGLSHQKSHSLIGTSFSTTHASSNISVAPSIPSGNSHRPTSSLDGTSMPQIQIPATTAALSNQSSVKAPVADSFANSTNNATSIASSTYDPWAAADFSVFETPIPPPKPKSTSAPRPSLAQTHNLGAKSVPIETTRAVSAQRNNGKTREEIEQQRTVARIIKGLPDLSYMLRR